MILEMGENKNNTTQSSVISDALKKFKSATKTPEIYLRTQNKKAENSKELVKNLFDYTKSRVDWVTNNVPDELIVDDMDEEQIWQQLELQNEFSWSKLLKETSKLLQSKDEAYQLDYKFDGDESDSESQEEEEQDENESDISNDEDPSDDENLSDDDADNNETGNKSNPFNKSGRTSIVDDEFFKLSEMEAFLEVEDKKEMQKHSRKKLAHNDDDDDEEIDYFNVDDENDDENSALHYKFEDFFDRVTEDLTDEEKRHRRQQARELKNAKKLKQKKVDLGLEDSDIDEEQFEGDEDIEEEQDEEELEGEEDEIESENEDNGNKRGKVKFDLSKNSFRSDSENSENENENDQNDVPQSKFEEEEKSTFEQRQERLRVRIQDMEDQAMGERSWQLKGEIDSTSRPQNSLLEEVLEFDATTRPAPIITEETTLQLEDIIRQRIKDKSWNDVERKYKPTNTPQEFRKKLVLDQEKSKESLAQIYEKEYINEMAKLDPNATNKDDEEPKEHQEIRSLMKSLFIKLDALSNFFYTPKPVVAEAKIITNIPAINMEEVAPVAISDAQLLAPEEVKYHPKGDVLGKSERSKTDKNRERRQKKIKQKVTKIATEKREAEQAKLGIAKSSKQEQKKLLDKVTKSRNVQKMKESTDGKSFKSSKQFFNRLQDEVTTNVKKIKSKGKRSAAGSNDLEKNAKRFKM